MQHFALVLSLIVLSPTVLGAQQSAVPLEPEARVRLLAAPPAETWLRGRVQSVTADTLTLRTSGSVQAVPLAGVRQLEVSRGRNRLLWTLGGVAVGAVGGILYTRATDEDDPADIGGASGTAEGVGNTVVGMLAGGLAGFFVAPERWRALRLPLDVPR